MKAKRRTRATAAAASIDSAAPAIPADLPVLDPVTDGFVTDDGQPKPLPDFASDTAPSPQQETAFSTDESRALLGALGQLEAIVFSAVAKVPLQVTRKIFTFDDEETDLIAPPLAAVLSKYSSEWLKTHKEEAVLILVLVSIHQKKFAMLASARHAKQQPQGATEARPS